MHGSSRYSDGAILEIETEVKLLRHIAGAEKGYQHVCENRSPAKHSV
jgi:hypothetical protein